MKLFLKIICGIALCGVAGIALVFYLTGGMAEEADRFFAEVKKGEYETIYADMSQSFKDSTTIDKMRAFLNATSLNTVVSTNWSSRSINMSTGKLEGTVTTDDGKAIPLQMDFVKEDGTWKIFGLKKTPAGTQTASSTNTGAQPTQQMNAFKVPSNDELVKLVHASMLAFGTSIDAKNMTHFHSQISNLWQSQYSPEKLEEAFGKLYNLGAKWSSLQNLSPIFEGTPALNDKGILVVSGYYPTSPDLLTYTQKYIREGAAWKLYGLNINFRKKE